MAEEGEEIKVEEVAEGTGNKRCCDHCGKEYNFKTKRSKFCSDNCRSLFGMKKRQNLNGTPKSKTDSSDTDMHDDDDLGHDDRNDERGSRSLSITKMTSSLRGLDPQSQYIIGHQENTINLLRQKNSKLEDKLESAIKERDTLQRSLDKIELEQSLNIQAKSGLNGISENPVILKLVEHAAPALGKWLEGVMTKQAGAGQLTGMESLSPEVQQQISAIANWYGQLTPEFQQSVFAIIDIFADTEDPEKLKMLLKRVNNIIKNGTAQNGHSAHIFPN